VAAYCVFSCKKIAEHQSRVLAGDSGYGGRQLRLFGGEGACLSCGSTGGDGAIEMAVSVWSWILIL
jgi:hypothetical protein